LLVSLPIVAPDLCRFDGLKNILLLLGCRILQRAAHKGQCPLVCFRCYVGYELVLLLPLLCSVGSYGDVVARQMYCILNFSKCVKTGRASKVGFFRYHSMVELTVKVVITTAGILFKDAGRQGPMVWQRTVPIKLDWLSHGHNYSSQGKNDYMARGKKLRVVHLRSWFLRPEFLFSWHSNRGPLPGSAKAITAQDTDKT